MKKIIIFFTILTLGLPFQSFAQPTPKQRRERIKLVKRVSKTKNPLIRLNENRELDVDEFLSLSDSILWIRSYRNGDTHSPRWGNNSDGLIEIWTVQYHDMWKSESRKNSIQKYRENEFKIFFGRGKPLILFGDQEISRKEFIELPEDTVAFVNFYLTDFVKRHYVPKGSQGIVYVCPRNIRSKINYVPSIDLPANGRNYIEDFYKDIFPCFAGGNKYSHMYYIREKVKEYKEKIGEEIKATVYISCVIRPNGTIDPILVEDIQTQQELTDAQTKSIVNASEEIILTMPRWEMPGGGIVYDKNKRVYLEDMREYSVSIPISFGNN